MTRRVPDRCPRGFVLLSGRHGGPSHIAMKRMICRNKVRDYDVWRPVFDENLPAAREAGLILENLWRSIDDPDEVFFIFTVADLARAQGFVSDPASAEAGERSGVIDGACWIVE